MNEKSVKTGNECKKLVVKNAKGRKNKLALGGAVAGGIAGIAGSTPGIIIGSIIGFFTGKYLGNVGVRKVKRHV